MAVICNINLTAIQIERKQNIVRKETFYMENMFTVYLKTSAPLYGKLVVVGTLVCNDL